MFLSKLVVNVGDRSDRRRPGRQWIEQPYRIHQRLCMAFPNAGGRADAQFLKPFDPANFFDHPGKSPEWDATVEFDYAAIKDLSAAVHVERDSNHGFLFRVETEETQQPFILVQSAREPDWDYAFQNAGHLVNGHFKRAYTPPLQEGKEFRFRLRANPTRRAGTLSKQEREAKTPGRHGKRRSISDDVLLENWLIDRACGNEQKRILDGGFQVLSQMAVCQGRGRVFKNEQPMTFHAVLFEGFLRVTNVEAFSKTLARGIGPGKAFGFGLLSILPA